MTRRRVVGRHSTSFEGPREPRMRGGRERRGAVIAEVAARRLIVVLAVGCPMIVLR